MAEIFKPRANMVRIFDIWECRDKDGNYICDGGPSRIWLSGDWEFWDSITGYHRLDGPVIPLGLWFVQGKNVTEEIKKFAKENDIDLDNLSDEDKVMIAMKFS